MGSSLVCDDMRDVFISRLIKTCPSKQTGSAEPQERVQAAHRWAGEWLPPHPGRSAAKPLANKEKRRNGMAKLRGAGLGAEPQENHALANVASLRK